MLNEALRLIVSMDILTSALDKDSKVIAEQMAVGTDKVRDAIGSLNTNRESLKKCLVDLQVASLNVGAQLSIENAKRGSGKSLCTLPNPGIDDPELLFRKMKDLQQSPGYTASPCPALDEAINRLKNCLTNFDSISKQATRFFDAALTILTNTSWATENHPKAVAAGKTHEPSGVRQIMTLAATITPPLPPEPSSYSGPFLV